MKKTAITILVLAAALLLPTAAAAANKVMVCRGGKFRLFMSPTPTGPKIAAKFKKYSTSKAFTRYTSGAKKNQYPLDKLQTGQCAILNETMPKVAKVHFEYKFTSPVDICTGALMPKYQAKDIRWNLGLTAQTKAADKHLLAALLNNKKLFMMVVSPAGSGKTAYWNVKNIIGSYNRSQPTKPVPANQIKSTPGLKCWADFTQNYFKVK